MSEAAGVQVFVIKSSVRPDTRIATQLSSTLAQFKAKLQQQYPGNPAPAHQTVIHAGRVLKSEDAQLSTLLGATGSSGDPIYLHLVVKTVPPPAGTSAVAAASSPSPAGASPGSAAAPAAAASSAAAVPASAGNASGAGPSQQPVSSGAHVAASAAQQPGVNEYWYQQPGYPPPWAMPQGPPPGSQPPGSDAYAQLNPALAAAYSAAMASLADGDSASGGAPSGANRNNDSGGGGAPGAGNATGAPPFLPEGFPPFGGQPPFGVPMGYPIVALVPVGMMNPYPPFPGQQHQGGSQQHTQQPGFTFGASPPNGQPNGQDQQPGQQGMPPPFYGAAFPGFPFPGPPPPPQHQQNQPPYGFGPPGFGFPAPPHPYDFQQPPGAGQQQYHPVHQHAVAGLRQRRPGRNGPADGRGVFVARDVAEGMQQVLADAERRGGQRRVRMVRINLNLRAILQAAVLLLLLYQHCPPGRFLALVIGGALLYLSAYTPMRRWLQRAVGLAPAAGHNLAANGGIGGAAPNPPAAAAPAAAGGNAAPGGGGNPPADLVAAAAAGGVVGNGGEANQNAAGAGNAAGNAAGIAQQPGRRPGGIVRELQALLLGFFTSLLPGWNMNPEDAAAFAAAQQLMAAEAAREAAAAAAAAAGQGGDADVPQQ